MTDVKFKNDDNARIISWNLILSTKRVQTENTSQNNIANVSFCRTLDLRLACF